MQYLGLLTVILSSVLLGFIVGSEITLAKYLGEETSNTLALLRVNDTLKRLTVRLRKPKKKDKLQTKSSKMLKNVAEQIKYF